MGRPNFATRTVWTGDNLDVLRGINSESVDLIYLDPPFNSNRNYAAPIGRKAAGAAFKDTWTLDDVDEAWHGEIADRDPALHNRRGGTGPRLFYEELPHYDGRPASRNAEGAEGYRQYLPALRPDGFSLSQVPYGCSLGCE